MALSPATTRAALTPLLLAGGGVLVWQGRRLHGRSGPAVMAAGLALVGAGLARPVAEQRVPRGAVTVQRSVTIARPRALCYRQWRDPAILAALAPEVLAVEALDERRWRWTARTPGGVLSWIAEIDAEEAAEKILWHADGPFRHCGMARFRDAPGGRGTEITVTLSYQAPLGRLGRAAAWLAHREPGREVSDMLRRLKQRLETGQVTTVTGQSHGRRALWHKEAS